jgi:hypothetical protein
MMQMHQLGIRRAPGRIAVNSERRETSAFGAHFVNGHRFLRKDGSIRISACALLALLIGERGNGNGQMEDVTMLAYDHARHVLYVVDRGNTRIQMFGRDGKYMDKWGMMGTGNGEFDWPTGIACGSNGAVYVVDTNNNRIQKFK